MEYRVINGHKIREQRGSRSIRDVVKAQPNQFSVGALHKWETGKCRPTDEKLPYLLAALGCDYEDISEPKSLALQG